MDSAHSVSATTPRYPQTVSQSMIAYCVLGSIALIVLAVLIQSEFAFIIEIQRFISLIRLPQINFEDWKAYIPPTMVLPSAPTQSDLRASKKQPIQPKPTKSRKELPPLPTTTIPKKKPTSIPAGISPTTSHHIASALRKSPSPAASGSAPKPTPSSPPKPSAKTRRGTSLARPSSSASSPHPNTLDDPAMPSTKSSPGRTLTRSTTVDSFLNPHAAAYEFQARYYDLPSDTITNYPIVAPAPSIDMVSKAPVTIYTSSPPPPPPFGTRQLYDAFLVLDVEATCAPGSTFDYPNEIIEWPVILMRWADRDETTGIGSELIVVDEFQSFIRPTYRPHLTDFCKNLTGITQDDIEPAPTFSEMLVLFEDWLRKHGLLPPPEPLLTPPSSREPSPPMSPAGSIFSTDMPLDTAMSPTLSASSLYSSYTPPSSFGSFGLPESNSAYDRDCDTMRPRFAWATDGPFDLRDFLVKQCFISKIPIPEYFLGDIIDVRRVVTSWVEEARPKSLPAPTPKPSTRKHTKTRSLNIPKQLQALSLGTFTGQQHRGIDDARNIARIIQALAKKEIRLEANMYVNSNRRWSWMGPDGVILPPALPTVPSTPI